MTLMIKIVCEKCNHEFTLKAQDILEYKYKDIEAQYFKCEKCKWIHITMVNDNFINNLARTFQRLKRIGNLAWANETRNRMIKHLEFIKPLIKESIMSKNA